MATYWQTSAILIFALGVMGCNAFNDQQKENWAAHDPSLSAPENPAGGEGDANPSVSAPGESTFVCDAKADVTFEAEAEKIAKAEDETSATTDMPIAVVDNQLNAAIAKSSAEWINDSTTTITTWTDDEKITLTVQKSGDAYTLCGAGYTKGETTLAEVTGNISVTKFNEKGEGAMANAGTFSLTFSATPDASKAAGILLGAKAETQGTTVEGSYATDRSVVVSN
jgi:hypothetical protein